jgi:branched-chain amino acid transport system ATP-binding protein
MNPTQPPLEVRGLVKHFDGVQAVRGVSFTVHSGECVALIGPNGAGKSTCFACIAGQHTLTAGAVLWRGHPMHTWPPGQRLRAGVARTFQVAQTFEALTVLQNVQLSVGVTSGFSAFKALKNQATDSAMALLDGVGLAALAALPATDLAYGQRKRLELAIALGGLHAVAATDGLLLLDEPAAGLAADERASLMALVQALARRGMAVLYTEHNMDAVFGVADRVLVLIDGQIAAQGLPDDVARNATVLHRYLGQDFQVANMARAAHA